MRDHILLYVNGHRHEIRGDDVFRPLSKFLRGPLGLTGTKLVCEEGDCGSCTVLVGRPGRGALAAGGRAGTSYKAVDSCILFPFQVDGASVVTIEGLLYEGKLNPVQTAMVEHHGAQCGFCTPGFVVAMYGHFALRASGSEVNGSPVSAREIKDACTGNLCRCTGYEPIVRAGMSVHSHEILALDQLVESDEMRADLESAAGRVVSIEANDRVFYSSPSLDETLDFLKASPDAVIVAGGTDIGVRVNKRGYAPRAVVSLGMVSELSSIRTSGTAISVGANVNLSDLEKSLHNLVPEWGNLLWLFGSPQIRNAGTLAGNIVNASPIADTLPFLCVMNAQLELAGAGTRRTVGINEFYQGYKRFDLKPGEIVAHINIPLPGADELLRSYKVSRRKHLDISTFSAAIRVKRSGSKIAEAMAATGGVAATVVRLRGTEDFLRGAEFSEETFLEAGRRAASEVTPISDVRGSSEFRSQLMEGVFARFYQETAVGREQLWVR